MRVGRLRAPARLPAPERWIVLYDRRFGSCLGLFHGFRAVDRAIGRRPPIGRKCLAVVMDDGGYTWIRL